MLQLQNSQGFSYLRLKVLADGEILQGAKEILHAKPCSATTKSTQAILTHNNGQGCIKAA